MTTAAEAACLGNFWVANVVRAPPDQMERIKLPLLHRCMYIISNAASGFALR
jgi:hypothetical protein